MYLTGTPDRTPDSAPGGTGWTVDEHDPLLWWTAIDGTEMGDPGPVLVAAGVEDTRAGVVFLDLAAGPATHATTGDERTGLAFVQSVAAQLEARLPEGAVAIGPGVHPRFPGTVPSAATGFLIAAGVPEDDEPDLRTVRWGGARGHARLLAADRTGLVRPLGTPLVLDVTPLPRSVARTLDTIPLAPRRPATAPVLDEDAFVATLDNPRPRPATPALAPPVTPAHAPPATPTLTPVPTAGPASTSHDDEFGEPERAALGVSAGVAAGARRGGETTGAVPGRGEPA